jgi:uncharacterized protein YjbI with pentapeptide repeats
MRLIEKNPLIHKRKWVLLTARLVLTVVASLPVAGLFYVKLYPLSWSGFGPDSNKSTSVETTIKDGKVISTKKTEAEHFQSAKTLWDWLGLAGTIAIPIVIFQFQRGEQRRSDERANLEKQQADKQSMSEKEIAAINLREDVLQCYIDRMSELLINQDTRTELILDKTKNNDANHDNPVRDVARIRTITILRRMEGDTERQDRVLHFLRDAELLGFLLDQAKLERIDLSNTNLRGINFTHTDFSGANLIGVNLAGSDLHESNLSDANLSGANLSGAFLTLANCSDANLKNTNLENAFLGLKCSNQFFKVKFNGANLDGANLKGAKNIAKDSISDQTITVDLSPEQVLVACNWDKAQYDDEYAAQIRRRLNNVDIDRFWELNAGLAPEGAVEQLRDRLSGLEVAAILAYKEHFDRAVALAYQWDLWAAARIIEGSCSDDGFIDFRYGLISRGRSVFEAAITDPDSLVDFINVTDAASITNESFGYVAREVYESKTNQAMPKNGQAMPKNGVVHPSGPGEDWDFDNEQQCKQRLPKLWAKFRT